MTFQLDDDDRPIGSVLTRREVLALLGYGSAFVALAACVPGTTASPSSSTGAGTPAGTSPTASAAASAAASGSPSAAAVPACIVRPELTEGPFFVDEKLDRSDIRSDPADNSIVEGAELDLTFMVWRLEGGSCVQFEGAVVDVWHCDALGVYSDVQGAAGSRFCGATRPPMRRVGRPS